MSRILAVHNSHNASICEIDKGNIIYFQEAERLNRFKKSNNWEILFNKYRNQKFDKIIFVEAVYIDEYRKKCILKDIDNAFNILNIKCSKIIYRKGEHHFFHACAAFYNSGFKKSYVFVADGGGCFTKTGQSIEMISLYYFNKNKFKTIYKVYRTTRAKEQKNKNKYYINTVSLGNLFEIVRDALGYKEEGSVMGMSSYFDFEVDTSNMAFKKFNHFQINQDRSLFMYTRGTKNTAPIMCKAVQQFLEQTVFKYIKNILKGRKRNICVSGGVFQNTVLNSKLLDIAPNLYVDPFADDSGLSMGAALWYANQEKYKCSQIKNLFLGDLPDYSMLPLKDGINVSPKDVAKLIAEKNIVAIYQGRNEMGKRALGNRSFLYDPRDFFGKERLNMLKQREFFRPTAGTVLHEHANEWFDMKSKKETPFMSYVFRVKKEGVPGMTHVDNTCRIQTLKKEQNFHYYNLIKAFYDLTGVPMVLNTSFNYAGQPLINTVGEAVDTLLPIEALYQNIYFPEIGKLYSTKNFSKRI
jgi:carbamoyltransferase|tara:strand:+ start:40 stop:1614 length:1575 start_codon:yes stop_codon:yes gene_type:complete